ncbi:hypothetical protein ACSBR1_037220 [Camellia fascicularis]
MMVSLLALFMQCKLDRFPLTSFHNKQKLYFICVCYNKLFPQVLSGITPLELHIFDTFEDVEYKRCTVEVSLMDGSQKLQAHAYVWANSGDPNLYGNWIFEEWRQAQMKGFIKMTMRFMEELEQPESKARVETYESFYQPSG